MLYITTKGELIKPNTLILNVDSFFNTLSLKEDFMDAKSMLLMKLIDGVSWRDEDVIKTKFGTTTMKHLSTGCKTILLAMKYGKEMCISALECGENAVTMLLFLSLQQDINIYTTSALCGGYDDRLKGYVNGIEYRGYDIFLNTPTEE